MSRHLQHIVLPADARILIVKLASIGDLLLCTPALRALRETYPQARIDLLVAPESANVLKNWQVIDHSIVLDKYLFDEPGQILLHPDRLLGLTAFWKTLREGHYDAVLLLHHLTLPFGRLKHQALVRATGAKWRVGLDNGHGWFLNVRVKDDGFGALHEAEYCMAVAQAVGAKIHDKGLSIPLSTEDHAQAYQLLYDGSISEAVARPIIALHPGSGGYSTARRWAPERFARLADTLYHDFGGQVVLVGGPEEAELHQQIISMLQSSVSIRSLAGKGSIHVTAALLQLVDLFIGNDAGPMHLAAAVGTPVVAIFGLSNYRAWGPYTGDVTARRAEVVHLDLPCMPCFYHGHQLGTPEGCATRDCLAMLGVDRVAVVARKMLHSQFQQRTPVQQ